MKKLLLPLLLAGLLGACARRDDPAPTPAYATYTPISGQLTVSIDGLFRPSGQDTTAVLSSLQLRKGLSTYGGQAADVYELKGDLSRHEALYLRFYLPPNRTGTGPWAALEVDTQHLLDGKVHDVGGGSGSLAQAGDKFTADFDVAAIRGRLQ